jgi:hypothetical protein
MSTAIAKQEQSAIRFALGEVWSQNFKLFPAGAGWAISLFLLMNYPSFLIKIPALLALNLISIYSAATLHRTRLPLLRKKLLAVYLGVDIFFLVCLHNVIYFAHAPESTKLVLVSNFCFSFILLAFLSVPLATWITMKSDRPVELSEIAKRSSKRTIVFALLVIAAGWLTIFPYIFFGLPFAQLLIIGSTRRVQS